MIKRRYVNGEQDISVNSGSAVSLHLSLRRINKMRMKDKVVLVTGGAAGIGKATALRFAEEGAKVVICDVNEAAGQETAQQLGPGAAFYKDNVANRGEAQKWVEDVVAKYGRIDVLVNHDGILRDGQLIKFKEG